MRKLLLHYRWFGLLALAIFAGALLRAPMWYTTIGAESFPKILWYDEAYSALFAEQPLDETLRLSGNDTTPGFFVVLLSFWLRVFGSGIPELAALSFLLSLAAIICVALAGREMFGPRAGLIAALLLALNPLHVKYATEIRAYNLLVCIAALSLLFSWRYVRDRKSTDAAAWATTVVLGMLTHYGFVAMLAVQMLFMGAAFASESKREFRRFLRLCAGIAAAMLPLLIIFRRWGDFFGGDGASSNLVRGYGHGDLFTIPSFFASLAFGQEQTHPLNTAAFVFAVVAGTGIAAAFVTYIYRQRREQTARYLIFVMLGGIVVLMFGKLLYSPRYFLVFVPAFVLLLGKILADLRPQRFLAAFAACAIVIAWPLWRSYTVHPSYVFTYYAPFFAERISDQARRGDLVLTDHFTDVLFRRYYRGSAPVVTFFPRDGRNVVDLAERFRTFDYNFISERDFATLKNLTAGYRRIWTVDYEPQRSSLQDPEGLKRRWFESHFFLIDRFAFPSDAPQKAVLSLYERI